MFNFLAIGSVGRRIALAMLLGVPLIFLHVFETVAVVTCPMNTTCTSSCSSYFSAARCVASCGNDTVPVDGNSLIPSYCKCAFATGGPTVTRVQRYDQNITIEIV